MLDTFDPRGCSSARDVIAKLAKLEIKLSNRQAARVWSLGHKGVFLSPAVLEEIEGIEGHPVSDKRWAKLPEGLDKQVIDELLEDSDFTCVEDEGYHVLLSEEAEIYSGEMAMVPVEETTMMLGAAASFFWDKERLEQATVTLLDSEDEEELVESFRYLFRALRNEEGSLQKLLVSALKRGKKSLSEEVARQVREYLDSDFGERLAEFVSERRIARDRALRWFVAQQGTSWSGLFAHILPALLEAESDVIWLAESVGQLMDLLEHDLEASQRVLRRCWEVFDQLEPEARRGLIRAGTRLATLDRGFARAMEERLESARSSLEWLFFAEALSQLEPPLGLDLMLEKFASDPLEANLERRLPVLLARFGELARTRLTEEAYYSALPERRRLAVFELWDGSERFCEIAFAALEHFHHDTLAWLARSGHLLTSGLVDRIREWGEVEFFLRGAEKLEDPDDEPVFQLLAQVAPEAPARVFAKYRRKAEVESAATSHQLQFLSRLASFYPAEKLGQLSGWMDQVETPKELHPVYYEALGRLASTGKLSSPQVEEIYRELTADFGRYPEYKFRGTFFCHPVLAPELKRAWENRVIEELTADSADRHRVRLLLAELLTFLRRGQKLEEPFQLVGALVRTVLSEAQEEKDLQQAMLEALAAADDGDGSVAPQAWDREDRDVAVQIVGALALGPVDPRLRRMLVVRLSSFAEDWLMRIEGHADTYAFREVPFWQLFEELLDHQDAADYSDSFYQLGAKLLDSHTRHPGRLQLEMREALQKFLLVLVQHRPDWKRAPQAVQSVADLEPLENQEYPVGLFLLEQLARSVELPRDLAKIVERSRKRWGRA